MSQAELRVISGKQAGSSIPLKEGKFIVGREEDCHLRPNSDLVSRHHCVFTVDEYGIRLRDLGSTNGTFVNGERIKGGVTLNPGDKVSIGKLEFELVDLSAEATSTNLSSEMNTQITEPTTDTADDALTDIIAGAEDSPAEEPSNSETITDLPQMAPQMQQPPPEGDTQFMQPGMQMPQMGYPMGYPQQMMPYGYPQYPQGMYPPQMGYPQQYPGMYPQQPMPEQQPPQDQSEAKKVEEPAIRLPDPTTTGAKVEPPKPAEGGGEKSKTADQKSKEEAPGAAGDIIQQYLNRRPGNKE